MPNTILRPLSPVRLSSARLLVALLLCSALTTFLLHRFVFAVYIIEGSSMSPTLKNGDTALVNMLGPHLGQIERGEIVLVHDGFQDYATKRIVGLPGERIEFKEDRVYINGRLLVERYLPRDTATSSSAPLFVLGPSQYFVLGDNRRDSYDSRIYGAVPKQAIVGSYTRSFWACR